MSRIDHDHEHPTRMLSLQTRTRLLGTLNVAVALGGRSCGWGSCLRPRRTFIGHHRIHPERGWHFVRLVLRGKHYRDKRVLFEFPNPSVRESSSLRTEGSD